MRRIITVILFLVVVIGGSLGIFFRNQIADYITKERYSPEREKEDLKKAQTLLDEHKPQQAFELIDKYQQRLAQNGDIPQKWIDLYIKASVGVQSPERIIYLYQQYPHATDNNEQAALIVADVLIKTARTNDYKELRKHWEGKETKPEIWFVLDADKQLIDGDRAAAIKFLNSKSFEGANDIPRLVRLALLSVEENPRMSWEYLTEAYKKDPNNPEVRSYRARLLEAVGKTALALTEYLSAARLAPDNIVMRDQLAEFYRRHGRYKLALKIWEDSLSNPLSDFVWIKTWFWSRVATPIEYKWNEKNVPNGELQPLIDYLLTIKPDQYWDSQKFENVADNNRYLQSEQSTFWLRLLQAVKDDHEDKAWELLEYNHFNPVSWNPQLETALKRILQFRKKGSLVLNDTLTPTPAPEVTTTAKVDQPAKSGNTEDQPHPFFTQLDELAAKAKANPAEASIPPELQKLLTSKEVFAAAFLAGGWLEAALNFNVETIVAEGSPDWLAYGMAQAIRYNKGNLEALDYATKQKPTPTLDLLIGELLIANGSPDAGLERLLPLVDRTDDIGFRASWLVALLYAEREQYDKAKAMIDSHPRLANDVLGKEALARIALLQGNTELADKLYSALENESWEAKSYLARKAYAEQNWARAKELTETLLREFPNNMLLRENYEKILEEEAKAGGQNKAEPGKAVSQPETQKQPISKQPVPKQQPVKNTKTKP